MTDNCAMKRNVVGRVCHNEPVGSMNGEHIMLGNLLLDILCITTKQTVRITREMTPKSNNLETYVAFLNLDSNGYKTTINLASDRNPDRYKEIR